MVEKDVLVKKSATLPTARTGIVMANHIINVYHISKSSKDH